MARGYTYIVRPPLREVTLLSCLAAYILPFLIVLVITGEASNYLTLPIEKG